MKIVHVAIRFPPAEGGGEQVVYNLAKQQVKMGNEVYVITTNLMKEISREVDRNLPKRETMDGINVIRMKTYPTGLPIWGYGSIFFGLKRVLNEINPDVVHTHSYGYFHSDVLARLRRKSEWKIVMTSHGFTQGRGVFRIIKKLYGRTIGRKTIKNLDAKIAISKSDKKVFERLGAKNVHVIPNCIELSKFEKLPEPNIFRDKYNVKGEMILNVSRLSWIKGHRFLIEAFSEIVKKFDSTLVIVGEDWGELNNLKMLVNSLNLNEKVIFTGKISKKDLLSAYSSADLFVLSSVEEPFGIVLLEAMACGVPVVSTNKGGPPDIISSDCGVLVEPNANSLYDGIMKILNNEKLGKKLAVCGKTKVLDFTWEKSAEKTIKIYEECLATSQIREIRGNTENRKK